MRAYIRGWSAITAQQTFDKKTFLKEWNQCTGPYLHAIEPDYKNYINPGLLRRMSRIIKMGIATSLEALEEAEIEVPEAVIVGTGLGCMADTEKFLKDIMTSEEGILSPTAFIQSTHNTIAGQIALLTSCEGYNFTFTNRGHSFENALQDAMMLLQEGYENVLVGGTEETTETVYQTFYEMGCVSGQADLAGKPVLGEGASFFVLSNAGRSGDVAIDDVRSFADISVADLGELTAAFLEAQGLQPDDIDALVLGCNASEKDDFYGVMKSVFAENIPVIQFKNISGECFTASAFGLSLAANTLERGEIIPKTLVSGKPEKPLNRMLIYNHFKGFNHALILVSR